MERHARWWWSRPCWFPARPSVPRDERQRTPFELHQRHLVVIEGSIGPLNGLNLLIDTGTIPSMVDTRIARKLRLHAESSMLVAFGQQVRNPERDYGRIPHRFHCSRAPFPSAWPISRI